MLSRAELNMIAMAIERAENRLEVQRAVAVAIRRDWCLIDTFLTSMERHLAELHEQRRRLAETVMLDPFEG